MSRLVFTIEFAARSDNTPSKDGYTYHHILPWRYFYATGVVLAQVARRLVVGLSFSKSGNARFNVPALEAAIAQLNTPAKLVAAFGADHENFRNELVASNIKAFDLLTVCRDMHGGAGNNAIDDSLRTTGNFDFGAIGNLCGAPIFGGFLAMAPEHRSDDPGNGPETHRAFSFDETRWACLQLLATQLRAFCPELLGAKAGSTITATVEAEAFKVFKSNLDKLIAKHNSLALFDPSDWVLAANGMHAWDYIVSSKEITNKSTVGAVMQLRTALTDPAGQRVVKVTDATTQYRVFSPEKTSKKSLSFVNDPR